MLYILALKRTTPPTTVIPIKFAFMTKRTVKYAIMIFHHRSVTLKTRNSKLNTTPSTVVVLGGGRIRYRTDVEKNHMIVGSKEYPHETASEDRRTETFIQAAAIHIEITITMYPTPAASERTTNCFVNKNGRNVATRTRLAITK